jgi:hypothetical protein
MQSAFPLYSYTNPKPHTLQCLHEEGETMAGLKGCGAVTVSSISMKGPPALPGVISWVSLGAALDIT